MRDTMAPFVQLLVISLSIGAVPLATQCSERGQEVYYPAAVHLTLPKRARLFESASSRTLTFDVYEYTHRCRKSPAADCKTAIFTPATGHTLSSVLQARKDLPTEALKALKHTCEKSVPFLSSSDPYFHNTDGSNFIEEVLATVKQSPRDAQRRRLTYASQESVIRRDAPRALPQPQKMPKQQPPAWHYLLALTLE